MKPLLYYHESWWKVEDEPIWYLAGTDLNDPPLEAGKWYFSDESAQLNGPYNTREDAESTLKRYCEEWL